MRKLGRIFRRVLTAVSLLLFVAVLAAWVRGYWSWDTCYSRREAKDATVWRATTWGVEWGGGEVGVFRDSLHADADRAEAAGKTPGVQWERGLAHGSPKQVGRWYAESNGGTGWVWDHWGMVVGQVGGRVTIFKGFLEDYSDFSFLAFPCWLAVLVFGALPSWRCLVWWRGVRRRRLAAREGRCPVCGYDLRASPQRCPECGTAVEARETPGGGAV